MRKLSAVAVALALAAGAGAGRPARAGQPEACLASQPPTPLSPNPCSYKATVKGGIDALGDWTVRIAHKGSRTRVVDSDRLPRSCVSTGPRTICPIGTIKPGDTVTSRARSTGSVVGTGNPCPVPNPGLPPPIAGGAC